MSTFTIYLGRREVGVCVEFEDSDLGRSKLTACGTASDCLKTLLQMRPDHGRVYGQRPNLYVTIETVHFCLEYNNNYISPS